MSYEAAGERATTVTRFTGESSVQGLGLVLARGVEKVLCRGIQEEAYRSGPRRSSEKAGNTYY